MLTIDYLCALDPVVCSCRHRPKWDRRRLFFVTSLTVSVVLVTLLTMESPYWRRLPSYPTLMQMILPRHKPRIASQHDVYICGTLRGRVGNAFFNYVSLLGLARANNMTLLLKDDGSVLPEVLEHPPETARDFDERCENAWYLEQRKCCVYDERLAALPHDDRYLIVSCLISWRYFEGMKDEVGKVLAFRREVLVEARDIVAEVRRQSGNATLVGMHVRRGDQSDWISYWHGHNPVTPEYLARAMHFFTHRFPHTHFLVASDDTEWCRKHVSHNRSSVTIMEGNSAAVDIAALTLTDHMIISIGTFGWWAGYLNPGIKVYMKDFIGPHSVFAESFDDLSASDYIYPGWVGL